VRNTVRTLVLTAAMLGLAAGLSAPAQEKKGAKAEKAAKAGTIEIYEAKDGGFRYRIKDVDDHVIAMPARSFDKKEDVYKALDVIKATLNTVKPTEVKEDKKK
jgi:uncharacterized protein YegP (UPF0339 family)